MDCTAEPGNAGTSDNKCDINFGDCETNLHIDPNGARECATGNN